jgi:DNA-binding MarR family transcriptional regulator
MKDGKTQNIDEAHSQLRKHLKQMADGEPIEGLELVNLMRMSVHFIDASLSQSPQFADLSGPRMGILMRLLAEEERGNHQGIRPTRLSHYQNVKKNTVSSLLSGLEEQGLIERTIDAEDKRGFNIRITPAGRERIISSMPERVRLINELTAVLTVAEKQQLITLLEKLRRSIITSHQDGQHCHPGEAKA